jgi:membrane-bound lytic murein transglycosylase A
MDTLPEAQAALQGLVIAYLDNPLDVLALQIQGSGQLSLMDESGASNLVRLAFSGSNNQPYKSVGAWLRDQYGLRDLSWPSIRAWAQNHPEQTNALLWSDPRVVFFKEEPLAIDNPSGPRGAQGVALTAGRSIAIDPKSIPYGVPVWLASQGSSVQIRRLVLAQDTGSAIVGAVRADYFVGSGLEAGEIAGKLKQPLQLWVLWPK